MLSSFVLELIEAGRGAEVETALRSEAEYGGLDATCLYAVFLASAGRAGEASAVLSRLVRRMETVQGKLLLSNALGVACMSGEPREGESELAGAFYEAHVGFAPGSLLRVCERVADCCFYLGRHEPRERLIAPLARLPYACDETTLIDVGECKLLAGRYEDASAYFQHLLSGEKSSTLSEAGKTTCGVSLATALSCRHLFAEAVGVLVGLARSDLAERVGTYAPVAEKAPVSVVGLKRQVQYNGVGGHVEQFASGKYTVRLVSGHMVCVRPENMRPVHVRLSSRRPVVVVAA